MRHKTSASVPNVPSTVNATRAAPPPPGKKVTKQRRMSSREFMQQAATANNGSSSAGRNAGGKTTAAFPAVTKSKPPPPSPSSSSSGHHVRAATTGGINKPGKGQISLPQHPDIKLHVTEKEKKKIIDADPLRSGTAVHPSSTKLLRNSKKNQRRCLT